MEEVAQIHFSGQFYLEPPISLQTFEKSYLINKIVFFIGNTIGKPATVTYTTQKIGSTTPPPVTGTDF